MGLEFGAAAADTVCMTGRRRPTVPQGAYPLGLSARGHHTHFALPASGVDSHA